MVVWGAADGSCSITAMPADLQSSTVAVSSPCAMPYALGDTGGVVVAYQRDTSIAMRSIAVSTSAPPAITVGAERVLVTGTAPRVFAAGGHTYLAWTDNSLRLAIVDSGVEPITLDGLPAGVPDAWDVTTRGSTGYVFAVWGNSVYAIATP
jgi:hypothetical protein